jgi:hypothetical protein
MKPYYTICLCLAASVAAAQIHNGHDSDHFEINPPKPVKATIYRLNNSPIRGLITKLTDSMVLLSISSPTEAGQQINIIRVSEIHKIKVKRNAIVNGMAGGAVLGGLAGYGLGYISYSYNESISDQDNHDNQKGRAAIGALIGAIPTALLGGMVGGVITKRTFRVDGNKASMLTLKKVLEN